MSAKLFLGNLSPDTTTDELRSLLNGAGGVESCQLITDRDTGRSRGYAFAQMGSDEAAGAAIEKLNGQELHGRALKVLQAGPRALS